MSVVYYHIRGVIDRLVIQINPSLGNMVSTIAITHSFRNYLLCTDYLFIIPAIERIVFTRLVVAVQIPFIRLTVAVNA